MKIKALILVLFLLPVSCWRVFGGESSFGLFNSLKGIGLSYETSSKDGVFSSITAYADIYDLPLGRTLYPGGKIVFLRNKVLRTFEHDGVSVGLYLGAGAAAGYVHDFEAPKNLSQPIHQANGFGISAAAAGTFGARFDFGHSISLDLSVESEIGAHIVPDANGGNAKMSLYKNGLIQTLYPQLKIMWRF